MGTYTNKHTYIHNYIHTLYIIHHTYVHPLLYTIKNKVNIEKRRTAGTDESPGGADQITSAVQ